MAIVKTITDTNGYSTSYHNFTMFNYLGGVMHVPLLQWKDKATRQAQGSTPVKTTIVKIQLTKAELTDTTTNIYQKIYAKIKVLPILEGGVDEV